MDDVAAFLSKMDAAATWSSTGATPPEVEKPRPASSIETVIAPQHDAPSVAEEQQIMESKTQSRAVDDVTAFMSERGAVATWSSTEATPREAEHERLASPLETTSVPPQEAPMDEQTIVKPKRSKADEARPIATQSARIAATIEHLRILEESRQRDEGDEKFRWATRVPLERGHRVVLNEAERNSRPRISAGLLRLHLDHNERDTTLERLPAESFNPPPVKRCPKCNTTYGNALLTYCAYDATRLISVDGSLVNYSASIDWSRQTLWVLVAIIAVLGASLGYLINNYRSIEKVSSAPTAAPTAQLEQPENPRKDGTTIAGELSGMEVDVPKPEYPAKARTEGVSGTVTVRVQVNKKGRVVLARSSGGDWRFRAAAVAAAKKATFSPEKLAAQGGVVSGTITYNFVAQTESPAATGSQTPTQTNSPSANGSSPATGPSEANIGGDLPVLGGPLVGAESNLPQPDYPEMAKSKGIYGTITVVVRVNRAGKVISWSTSQGDSQLRAAALKAAKKATFSPDKLAGEGEVVGTITYNFKP